MTDGPVVKATELDTVDRLINAAIDALAQQGESGLRVDQVLDQAGVSVSSMYHHFGNRDGLIDAARVVEFTRSAAEDVMSIELSGDMDRESLLAQLDTINRELSHPRHEPARRLRLAILGRAATRPTLWAALQQEQGRAIDELSALVEFAQAMGLIREDVEPRSLAVYMMGHGLGRSISDLDPTPTDVESRNQVVDLVVRTFVTPPG